VLTLFHLQSGIMAAEMSLGRQDLLSMLKSLPPSAEVMEFYHAKIEAFEKEERDWIKR
jgi:hypothetical protein